MQIRLSQPELETAVREYVRNMGFAGVVTDMTFTATRNEGTVTEIEIGQPKASVELEVVSTSEASNKAPAAEVETEVSETSAETSDEQVEAAPVTEEPAKEAESLFGG